MPIWGVAWAGVWLAALVATRAQQPPESLAHAASSNAPPNQLSLADAQRMAFERNSLLAAAAGVDAATAQKIVVHEFPNPTLSLYSSLNQRG